MCGIVGYVGTQQAAPILLEGLSRLEYRGYDSAGICVEQNGVLKVEKAKGRLQNLIAKTENGALLPGGKTIKTGKLRSVLSEGMLCSLGELGLDKHDFPYAIEDGIFILEEDCKPGDDIKDVCMLDDTIVDFELTFNRPDCLAFTAIARESAAALNEKFKYTEPVCPKGDGKDDISDYLSVRVDDPTLCPRYCAKAVKNVKIAPSPLWLRARLRACGVRPINNIVDITNYVMLEYGQPMHSFDYDFIKSKSIIVPQKMNR